MLAGGGIIAMTAILAPFPLQTLALKLSVWGGMTLGVFALLIGKFAFEADNPVSVKWSFVIAVIGTLFVIGIVFLTAFLLAG